jgi:hypothetical protein
MDDATTLADRCLLTSVMRACATTDVDAVDRLARWLDEHQAR